MFEKYIGVVLYITETKFRCFNAKISNHISCCQNELDLPANFLHYQ